MGREGGGAELGRLSLATAKVDIMGRQRCMCNWRKLLSEAKDVWEVLLQGSLVCSWESAMLSARGDPPNYPSEPGDREEHLPLVLNPVSVGHN